MKKIYLLFSLIITLSLANAQMNTWNVLDGTTGTYITVKSYQFMEDGWGWYIYKTGSYSTTMKYTTDGGANWVEKDLPDDTTTYFDQLRKVQYITHDIGFAQFDNTISGNNDYKIFKTTDGGDTWSEVSNTHFAGYTGGNQKELGLGTESDLGCLRIVDENFIYGWNRGTRTSDDDIVDVPYISKDGGVTFTDIFTNLHGTTYSYIFDMEFLNSSLGFATIGIDSKSDNRGLMKTTDGGTTWTSVLDAQYWMYDIEIVDANTIYVEDSQEDLIKSTDGGSTWAATGFKDFVIYHSGSIANQDPNSEAGISSISSMKFFDANNGVVCLRTTQNGYYMARTSDGGATWTQDSVTTDVATYPESYSTKKLTYTASDKIYGICNGFIITNSTTTDFSGDAASIQNPITQNSISTYPNPVSDIMYIDGGQNCNVEVYNVVGKLVYSEKNQNQANLSKLQPGLYMVRITDNDNNSKVVKVNKR